MAAPIQERARFDILRYANCWEDADVLCEALAPAAGRRVLSVASAGDNSFALLAGGAEVVAADLSAAQLACVELKAAAIRHLDGQQLLQFLGARPGPGPGRIETYRRLRPALPAEARSFWDSRERSLAAGVIHLGKFEGYFRLFRRAVLPLVHGRRTVLSLLAPRPLDGRRDFYRRSWDGLRWRLLFRVFFSRAVMGRFGRDPEFFRYVEGSVADRILARARYALTELPTDGNPYLAYILTGGFGDSLPRYLQAGRLDAVRRGLERLVLFRGPVQEAARVHRGRGFDGFNLSDIFEYMDGESTASVYGQMLDSARPGARIAYWNMLAPRGRPEQFRDRARPLEELAARLFLRDRAFFYSAFRVDEVAGPGGAAP
jgi:S-adenosylmethionine-diacylglycerol 3-amino-3-carboxypropyl transferase